MSANVVQPQNDGEPWEWHIVETYKGLINLSIEALKALLLINGGAAVAILAYLGNLASRTSLAHLPTGREKRVTLFCCWRLIHYSCLFRCVFHTASTL